MSVWEQVCGCLFGISMLAAVYLIVTTMFAGNKDRKFHEYNKIDYDTGKPYKDDELEGSPPVEWIDPGDIYGNKN